MGLLRLYSFNFSNLMYRKFESNWACYITYIRKNWIKQLIPTTHSLNSHSEKKNHLFTSSTVMYQEVNLDSCTSHTAHSFPLLSTCETNISYMGYSSVQYCANIALIRITFNKMPIWINIGFILEIFAMKRQYFRYTPITSEIMAMHCEVIFTKIASILSKSKPSTLGQDIVSIFTLLPKQI